MGLNMNDNFKPKRFGMTELRTHEQWAKLPGSASSVMHLLCSKVGHNNAVVISQQMIAGTIGLSLRTVQRAVQELRNNNWVRVTQLGASGTVNAYTINSEVLWTDGRDNLKYAEFSATIVASEKEQPGGKVVDPEQPLNQVPEIFTGSPQLSLLLSDHSKE